MAFALCVGSSSELSQAGYTLSKPVNLDASSQKAPKPSKASPKYIPYEEVQKHNTRESCWVIIDGQVYDATSVLAWHPGGAAVILKNAGKDATYVHSLYSGNYNL